MADIGTAKIATVAPGTQDSMAGALSSHKGGLETARSMLAVKRASGEGRLTDGGKPQTPQKTHGDPSEAARILQQRATQARQERQAEAARQAQEAAGAAGSEATNTAQDATEGLETSDQLQPDAQADGETNADEQSDPDQAIIDLGEDVQMTRAEVKQHLMRQADYTQKTQALSETVKAFEADRAQRLQVLDTLTQQFKSQIGQPKTMVQFMDEMGETQGLRAFAEQQARLEQLDLAYNVRAQEQRHHVAKLRDSTVKALAATHGDKAQGYFDQAVDYVAPMIGYDKDTMAGLLAHPVAVQLVHDAKAWRELQGSKGNVTKMIAGKPMVVKPGTKVSAQAGTQSKFQNAVAALKASGKRADAVQVMQARRAMLPG